VQLLSQLPLDEMIEMQTFKRNDVSLIFQILKRYAIEYDNFSPAVSLFHFTPYIYKDPLVPEGIFGGNVLLRVGDSLFSGDPNHSTGLESHYEIISDLAEKLYDGELLSNFRGDLGSS